jgi:hypothetical protein
MAASLLLERLQEAQASGAVPSDRAWADHRAHGLRLPAPPSLAPSFSCLLGRL